MCLPGKRDKPVGQTRRHRSFAWLCLSSYLLFLFKNDCGPSPLTKQINSPNYTIRSNQIRYFPHNMCGFRHVPVEAFMFPVEECSRAKGRAFMLRGERTSRVLYLCALRPHIQNRGSYTHIHKTDIYLPMRDRNANSCGCWLCALGWNAVALCARWCLPTVGRQIGATLSYNVPPSFATKLLRWGDIPRRLTLCRPLTTRRAAIVKCWVCMWY